MAYKEHKTVAQEISEFEEDYSIDPSVWEEPDEKDFTGCNDQLDAFAASMAGYEAPEGVDWESKAIEAQSRITYVFDEDGKKEVVIKDEPPKPAVAPAKSVEEPKPVRRVSKPVIPWEDLPDLSNMEGLDMEVTKDVSYLDVALKSAPDEVKALVTRVCANLRIHPDDSEHLLLAILLGHVGATGNQLVKNLEAASANIQADVEGSMNQAISQMRSELFAKGVQDLQNGLVRFLQEVDKKLSDKYDKITKASAKLSDELLKFNQEVSSAKFVALADLQNKMDSKTIDIAREWEANRRSKEMEIVNLLSKRANKDAYLSMKSTFGKYYLAALGFGMAFSGLLMHIVLKKFGM